MDDDAASVADESSPEGPESWKAFETVPAIPPLDVSPGMSLVLSFSEVVYWVLFLCIAAVFGLVYLASPDHRSAGGVSAVASAAATAVTRSVGLKLLRAAKKRCRIAFFRSFSPEHATIARRTLAPVLGAYGSLLLIADEAFVGMPEQHDRGGLRPDDLANWEDVLPTAAGHDWQDFAKRIIDNADLAVVDISRSSPHILFEVEETLSRLGRRRVLFIASESSDPQEGAAYLAAARLPVERHEALANGSLVLYGRGLLGSYRFRLAVYRWMRRACALDEKWGAPCAATTTLDPPPASGALPPRSAKPAPHD